MPHHEAANNPECFYFATYVLPMQNAVNHDFTGVLFECISPTFQFWSWQIYVLKPASLKFVHGCLLGSEIPFGIDGLSTRHHICCHVDTLCPTMCGRRLTHARPPQGGRCWTETPGGLHLSFPAVHTIPQEIQLFYLRFSVQQAFSKALRSRGWQRKMT